MPNWFTAGPYVPDVVYATTVLSPAYIDEVTARQNACQYDKVIRGPDKATTMARGGGNTDTIYPCPQEIWLFCGRCGKTQQGVSAKSTQPQQQEEPKKQRQWPYRELDID